MAITRFLLIPWLALLIVAPALAESDEQDTKAWATLLDLRIIDQVLLVYLEENGPVEPPADWTQLRSYSKDLPDAYRDRLPRKDAWGNEFLVGAAEKKLVVISAGANEIPDLAINLSQSDPPETAELSWGDDIVLLVGSGIENGPVTTLRRQRICTADLRTVGTAIESYSIDNNKYPRQDQGLLDLAGIESELEPVYIRTAPMRDPWGNPFLYWSNEESYLLISLGADGIRDRPYPTPPALEAKGQFEGEFTDPNTDIVFANGQFVQWPHIKRW